MNRTQMRGFATNNRGVRSSIKDRIGVVGRTGGARVGKQAKISGPGKLLASRLGLPVKSRVGVAKGLITKAMRPGSDARDKIILNRVSRGRVTDARSKIEAQRTRKKIMTNKVKSLKITAKVATPNPRFDMAPAARASSARYPPTSSGGGPGYNSYRIAPVSHGLFANDAGQQQHFGQLRSASMPQPRKQRSSPEQSLYLTRTVTNYQASPPVPPSNSGRGWTSSVAKVAPSFSSRSGGYGDDMEMDDEPPPRIRLSNSLQSRLDTTQDDQPRYKLIVSNLQPTVTTEDIAELFSDIASPVSATMTSPGHAEVIYAKKGDCMKAVDAYHNRLLDGSPMRVFMENSSTSLKSAAGATMKLPKASSAIKIQPSIEAIHKVLFTSSSSGNSTRGLFKGGQ